MDGQVKIVHKISLLERKVKITQKSTKTTIIVSFLLPRKFSSHRCWSVEIGVKLAVKLLDRSTAAHFRTISQVPFQFIELYNFDDTAH
jgi:hypothetical protein